MESSSADRPTGRSADFKSATQQIANLRYWDCGSESRAPVAGPTPAPFHPSSLIRHPSSRAFTLIETIGVLSVVAILVSVLAPGIMDVIDRARCSEVIASYNQVRAGAMAYAGKYGYLGGSNGESLDLATATNITANWDAQVLLPLEYIDQPFRGRVASVVAVELRPTVPANTQPNGTNTAYNLEGAAGNPNRTAGAKSVLDVKLENVAIGDARYINNAIDGDGGTLGETAPGTDLNGRVKYEFPDGVNAGEVRIYITHL